jgi:hypothetical protein
MRYTIRLLDASTWAAFAELAERTTGFYGGCWCMAYHPEVSRTDAAQNRAAKEPGSGTATGIGLAMAAGGAFSPTATITCLSRRARALPSF